MEENKRFKAQKLDEEDYEKTESGAKLLKEGSVVLGAIITVGGLIKKFGPSIVKNASKVFKA